MKSLAEWLTRKPTGPRPRRPLKRSKRVAPMSKKRKRIEPAYVAAKQAHLRDYPYCQIGPKVRQAGLKIRCRGRATHVHHIRGREGNLLCDRTYFLSSCDGECHPTWIHQTHVKEARELGLLG